MSKEQQVKCGCMHCEQIEKENELIAKKLAVAVDGLENIINKPCNNHGSIWPKWARTRAKYLLKQIKEIK
jgi:hypothetical protein